MTVKLIIKRNQYGSVKDGVRSQYVFSPDTKAKLRQLAIGGSEPATLGLAIDLLHTLTDSSDMDALVADIVASVDYDNDTGDRLWDISSHARLLAYKLAIVASNLKRSPPFG